MAVAVTFLEQDKQAPAQIAGQLAEFLNAAKTSLHIAIYDFRLTDPHAVSTVVGALTRAANRGLTVRIGFDAGKPAVATAATFARLEADPAPPTGSPSTRAVPRC